MSENMSNFRRMAGPNSPNMRRWSTLESSISDSYSNNNSNSNTNRRWSMLEWVREQRETIDWAREQKEEARHPPLVESQSMHGEVGERECLLVAEERMTQSARGDDPTDCYIEDRMTQSAREPTSADYINDARSIKQGAPVSVVNVNHHSTLSVMSDTLTPRSFLNSDAVENQLDPSTEETEEESTTAAASTEVQVPVPPVSVNQNNSMNDSMVVVPPESPPDDQLPSDDGSLCSLANESTGGSSIDITKAREIIERRAADRKQKASLEQSKTAQVKTQTKAPTTSTRATTRMEPTKNVAELVNSFTAGSDLEQPGLIPSSTEDSDDIRSVLECSSKEPLTLRDAFARDTSVYNQEEHGRREAISYLLQYEMMVWQQEAEEIATLSYLRPLLDRLHTLATGEAAHKAQIQQDSSILAKGKNSESLYIDLCQRSITYGELKNALDVLENQEATCTAKAEFVTQDKQLMMILRMLTQKHAPSEVGESISITWAEIIHCYRVCILGMSTLKHIPKEGSSKAVRSRAKDRILSQLSLFELPATQLLNEETKFDTTALDVSPDSKSGGKKNKKFSRRQTVVTLISVCTAASVLGFLAGSHFAPVEDQKTCEDGDFDLTFSVAEEPHFLVAYCPAEVPAVCPDDLTSNNTLRASNMNFEVPKPKVGLSNEPMLDLKAMPIADLNPNESAIDKTSRKYLSPTHKMVVSAIVGASAGIFAPPKVVALSHVVRSALSLNSLGFLPAALVVAGTIAVGVNIFKGIQFFFQRVLRRSS